VIVFDVSALVGAAIRRDGVPERALRRALNTDHIAVSEPVIAELLDVFARERLRRFLRPEMRDGIVSELFAHGVFFTPDERVRDCRDPKDDMYLELALASDADTLVSSDQDLLVLHPWRGVRILRPADYLAEAGDDA
jgi:putative PIN family toxin of toxin-antitoxin system